MKKLFLKCCDKDNSREKIISNEEENFLNDEEISVSRRDFLKKILILWWASLWLWWVDLLAKPNDEQYKNQELVFKKIWLDRIFNEFPELDWRWVKMWYFTVNIVDLKYDMSHFNFKDLWWSDENNKFHDHANSMISILSAKRNNWKWIAWIVPGVDLTAFKWLNDLDEIKYIYWEWIKLIWSSLIRTDYSKDFYEIEKFLEDRKDLIFIRSWWNHNEKLKTNPGNNLAKVKEVFTVWACKLNDKIHDFSATECDFYVNTWDYWKNKWIRKMTSDYFVSNYKTSEAAAILTWIVWLLRQILPNSSRKDIENILQKSARKKYSDWGYLVDAYDAVMLAKTMV